MQIKSDDELLDIRAAVLLRRERTDLPEPQWATDIHPKLQRVADEYPKELRGQTEEGPLRRVEVPPEFRDWSVPFPGYEEQVQWVGRERFGMPRINDEPDPYNPHHVGYIVNVSNLKPRTFRPGNEDFPLAPYRTGIAGDGVARLKDINDDPFTGDLGEILAADICMVDNGRILFGVRDDGKEPQLCLIGGKVDDREGLYEAAPREFREETGAVIDPARLKVVTVRVVTADTRNTDHASFVSMACRYDLRPGEAKNLGLQRTKEISGYHWLPFDPETGLIRNDTGLPFFSGHDQLAGEALSADQGRLAKIRAEDAWRMKQYRFHNPLRSAPSRKHVTVELPPGLYVPRKQSPQTPGTQGRPKPPVTDGNPGRHPRRR